MPFRPVAIALFSAILGGAVPLPAQEATFDVVLRGGRLLDGTGNPWRRVDVGIREGRVAAIGDLEKAQGSVELDLEDLYLAPGFIDVHSHAARGLSGPELSGAAPLLAQGITTVLVNPDGGGPHDLEWQQRQLLADGLGVHVAQLVPHGGVRRAVLRMADRAPSEAQLERMVELVRAGMEAGAFGLSTGLYYAPGSYAETEELIALSRVVAEYGGIYHSHIRDESDYSVGLMAAVDEVLRIAEAADLPAVVSHIKALGPRVYGFSAAVVRRIQAARDRGLEIWADQYPYEASGTSIGGALVPRWAQAGGAEAMRGRLADPEQRARIRADLAENIARRGGADKLQIGRYRPDPDLDGRRMAAIAAERGIDPIDLTLQMLEEGGASLVSFNMDEADIEVFMRQPWTMTCSDGGLVAMGQGVPHPRFYGTFPRKLGRYVRERGVLGLAAAVRSMTGLPAAVLGLGDRGVVREGAVADLVVFDFETIRDAATYEEPHQLAQGVVHVLVEGQLAWRDGEATGLLAGTVLRRPD